MKRYLALFVTLVLAVSMVACSGGAAPASASAQSASSQAAASGTSGTSDELQAALDKMSVCNLNMGISFGSSHRATEYMKKFAEALEDRSDGKIKITLYADESLVKNSDIYQALLDGIIDIGEADPSYSFASFPLGSAYFLPNIPYANSTVATYVASDWFKSDFDEMKAVHPLYGIGMTPSGIMSNVKIETVDDFPGVQIRAAGYPAKAITALGAAAVGITPPECYEALLKGTINAVFMPDEALMNWNFAEVVKYSTTIPGIATQCHFVAMNLNTYNSFPAPVQKMIDDVSAECEAQIAPLWDTMSSEAHDYAKTKGVEIYTVSDDARQAMMDKLAPVTASWLAEKSAAGLDGQAAIDHLNELVEKYNKIYG